MARDLEGLADVVVLCVKNAMAPVLERLALSEQKCAHLEAAVAGITELRDRVVIVETKSAIAPAPLTAAIEPVDLSPVLERVASLEARTERLTAAEWHITDIRDRLAIVETKAAAPGAPPVIEMPEPVDMAPVLERVAALETKSEQRHEHVTRRLAAVETRPEPVVVPALTPADVELMFRKSVEPVQSMVAEARERLIAVEARAPIPGPAGKDGTDGKDGAPGRDGIDGLSIEDLSADFDGDRTLTLKFARGSIQKDFPITLPYPRYEGVFIEGKSYTQGALTTWAGSTWHANKETTAKPGEGSKDWTLIVKRGRDGRDGKDAEAALPVVSVAKR